VEIIAKKEEIEIFIKTLALYPLKKMTIQEQCSCGMIIKGKSSKHLKHNKKEHLKSKSHKLLIKALRKAKKIEMENEFKKS